VRRVQTDVPEKRRGRPSTRSWRCSPGMAP